MSLHTYIDNEIPDFGEWTSVWSEHPDSVMLQGTDYAWPGRGSVGLRASCLETEMEAYCRKSAACPAAAPGASIALGFWYRLHTKPLDWSSIVQMNGTTTFLTFWVDSDGAIHPYLHTDNPPFYYGMAAFTITEGQWHYLQIIIARASAVGVADGEAHFYADGLPIDSQSGYQNYTKMAGADYDLLMGCTQLAAASTYVGDYDEIKVGDTAEDVAPYESSEASVGHMALLGVGQ